MFTRVLFLCSFFAALQAKDFSVRSQVFPIEERSLLELLETQKVDQELFVKKMQKAFREPKAIEIAPAKKERSFFFDPSFSFEEDLFNHEGKLIASKGQVFNPLEQHFLQEMIVFFDARDEKELQWALSQKNSLWILLGGSPLDLQERFDRPVFFDQMGLLSKKLGIQARPARVFQEGKGLRVEELCL